MIARGERHGRWLAGATLPLAMIAGCAAAPSWRTDLTAALADARREARPVVVYFALPGRDVSDRMQQTLRSPAVLDELAAGDFAAVIADGQQRLYAEWIGFGEGMGIAVLDGNGSCCAVRPGPQDADELVAFLRLFRRNYATLVELTRAAAVEGAPATARHAAGSLLLQLGNVRRAEPELLAAALGGVADARHRLARLYAQDGNLTAARRWLAAAPKTPFAAVTEGYVLFKERRHAEAAAVLEAVVRGGEFGDERQRALLWLGKALHENKQDDRAVPVLQALAAEGTGSTFEAAARHTLAHIADPQHGHSH